MARMRTLKPEFWADTRMRKLTPYARLFYMGMWNFSICHNGHLSDDAEELKVKILPTDDVDAEALLEELLGAGRVRRMTTPDGESYLWVPTLADHQKTDPRWKPRCPYCALQTTPEHTETHQTTPEVRRAPASRTRATPSHTKGGDGIGGDKNSSSPPPAATDDPCFIEFWAAYPRKVGKGQARKAWAKAVKAGAVAADIIEGAKRYSRERENEDAKFTAHPATWLHGERWDDTPYAAQRINGAVPFWDA